MPRSDLNDLAAFVAIADSLSFRAAASHIGVTLVYVSEAGSS
jgi:DNA-binding transcriptional LysR family regulator